MSIEPHHAHLAEMRLSVFERRHEDGLIEAREFAARHPDGARRMLREIRKAVRRG